MSYDEEHQQLLSIHPLHEFRATDCKRSGISNNVKSSAIGVSTFSFIVSSIYLEDKDIFISK
jgi:hypothetical protein